MRPDHPMGARLFLTAQAPDEEGWKFLHLRKEGQSIYLLWLPVFIGMGARSVLW